MELNARQASGLRRSGSSVSPGERCRPGVRADDPLVALPATIAARIRARCRPGRCELHARRRGAEPRRALRFRAGLLHLLLHHVCFGPVKRPLVNSETALVRAVGAEAGTRTPTGVLPLRPERSASANSATSARRARQVYENAGRRPMPRRQHPYKGTEYAAL